MTQQEPPKIEFPCAYSIRVVGTASANFSSEIADIVSLHDPKVNKEAIKTRDSKKGTFLSVHFVIEAQGEDHLRALHEDLKKHPSVKMVI